MGGAREKVVILGGGIAGMSAAQELIERGFDVEVFERKTIAGGKARSVEASPAAGLRPFGPRPVGRAADVPRKALPGEHGFRFFPGFYRHIVDTMGRIPYRGGSVAQNLVDTSELKIAAFDRPSYILPAESPRSPDDLKVDLFAIVAVMSGQAGVSAADGLFFAGKLWEFMTSCEERRLVEYERINWWDFIEAGSRSLAYQKYFGNGITRSLVAAKARRASTKTIGDIFVQIVVDVLLPGVAADRVLNGPTNDVWINPWVEYLKAKGVRYHFDSEVRSLNCQRGLVRSATIRERNREHDVTADYFIGALPVERMAELLSPELLAADPSLANLHELTEYVEWMNGIQFYLTEDVPLARGHVIFVDSPWALTLVSQPQFWKDLDLSSYGDGCVRGLLSVDISDWDVKGLNGKDAQHCTRQEIALETWEQLKRSLNVGGVVLRDEQLHAWFLDPDIEMMEGGDGSTARRPSNAEPLLVNYVDTWRIRPEAVTRIPNLFLASDYVRTYTDLATMEAANEAARRAVNGILRAARRDDEPCQIWNLHEPEILLPFRAYDRIRFRKGLGWSDGAMSLARSILGLQSGAQALSGGQAQDGPMELLRAGMSQILGAAPEVVARPNSLPDVFGADATSPGTPDHAVGDVEQVAADARASSDMGLRRLRIMGPRA